MPEYFSLSDNTPANRALRWLHLNRLKAKALVISIITWFALLLISAAQNYAIPNSLHSFLLDIPSYAQFLIATPIFILIEPIVDARLSAVAKHFETSGLIEPEETPAFDSARQAAIRYVTSLWPVILLIAAAYATSLRLHEVDHTSQLFPWRIAGGRSSSELSPAGWWFHLVSLPIYSFYFYQWLWRLIVWTIFLWRVSHLHLQLTATHPDGAGGLGFLNVGQLVFWYVIFAGATVLSAAAAQRIIFGNQDLANFESMLITYIIAVPVIFIAPLLVFSRKLLRTKLDGLLRYGALANEYTQSFQRKWAENQPREETLLGTSDIQSLADLNNSFEIVKRMRLFPFSIPLVIDFIAAAAIPMSPLVFTKLPAAEVLGKLYNILF